jgi:hypothetical protein
MISRGTRASFAFCCYCLAAQAFAQTLTVDPGAAEALLRAELDPSKIALNSDVCVKADGEPLASGVVRRLQQSGIKLADSGRNDCPAEIDLGRFSFRPELGTYEMRFSSQLFAGSWVAVLKHFDDGWHVVSTYHVGVWL